MDLLFSLLSELTEDFQVLVISLTEEMMSVELKSHVTSYESLKSYFLMTHRCLDDRCVYSTVYVFRVQTSFHRSRPSLVRFRISDRNRLNCQQLVFLSRFSIVLDSE